MSAPPASSELINPKDFVGVWHYIPSSSIPHIAEGITTLTLDDEGVLRIHTKMKLGAKMLGMWADVGTAVVDKNGRYKCPKGGGWHDIALSVMDDASVDRPARLKIIEYVGSRPIATEWEKVE